MTARPHPLKDRLRMPGFASPAMQREALAEIERLEAEVAHLRRQRDDLLAAVQVVITEAIAKLEGKR